MQKILIISNEELFNLLVQAKGFLPLCEILHEVEINTATFSEGMVIIGNTACLEKIENTGVHFIGLSESDYNANSTGIIIVKKPYYIKDIIEIIKTILVNITASGEFINIGKFLFDRITRTLIKDEIRITLTEKESGLVMILNEAGGQVVSRDKILKEVWRYESGVDTHTLETHIYRVRQKIGKENDFIGSSATGYFIKEIT